MTALHSRLLCRIDPLGKASRIPCLDRGPSGSREDPDSESKALTTGLSTSQSCLIALRLFHNLISMLYMVELVLYLPSEPRYLKSYYICESLVTQKSVFCIPMK